MRHLYARHPLLRRSPPRAEPHALPQEIKEAISGNLCRCTGYTRIFDAIEAAAEDMRIAAAGTQPVEEGQRPGGRAAAEEGGAVGSTPAKEVLL